MGLCDVTTFDKENYEIRIEEK